MPAEQQSHRILIVGGSMRSLFQEDGAADTHQPADGITGHGRLQRFVDAADYVILNPTDREDPLALPWNRAARSGVDAVNLSAVTEHCHGAGDINAVSDLVGDAGLDHFGVGRTLSQALRPLRVALPPTAGGGEIDFHSSSERDRSSDDSTTHFARQDSPGRVPLTIPDVPECRTLDAPETALHVALPHWGRDGTWRTKAQYQLAHRFLNKEYDLVVGYGAQHAQEVHRKRQRWVVYGLGDAGTSTATEAALGASDERMSFSFLAMLEITAYGPDRRLSLRLYPTLHPVEAAGTAPEDEFDAVLRELRARPIRPWRFDNPARTTDTDDLGPHIVLDLGDWPADQPPARLEQLTDRGDPSEWPLRSPDTALEDDMLRLNRDHNASMLGLGAQSAGAEVHWLSNYYAVVDAEDTRFLVAGALAHESALGSRIVGDKVLTAELLEAVGVSTPRTRLVASADEAVAAAREIVGPVVVKPRNGHKSQGVSTDLRTDDEVREAFDFARRYRQDVIVQEYIESAEELRVMASPREVLAVNIRIFPHVIGDGVSTIEQLIADKNLQRTLNPTLGPSPIPIDGLTRRHVERQGLALDSVVPLDQRIQVRNVGGVSVGADIHQALDETRDEIRETARRTIDAVPGLGWGGVDLIIEESTGRAFVIEVNTMAAFSSAAFPTYGRPRDVTQQIWRIRQDATSRKPDPDAPIELPELGRGAPLFADGSQDTSGPVAIARLMESSLRRQGFTVARMNSIVRLVTSPEGRKIWMTSNGLTAADRGVVRRFLRNHERVLGLLDLAEVPRVRGRSVSTPRAVARFLERPVARVVLTPREQPWGGGESRTLTSDEVLAIDSLPERSWLQAIPAGRRLRVLATPGKAWLITESSGESTPLSAAAVDTAGRAAVRAVRAVPELRWAAVDIVVRPEQPDRNMPQRALVEGLTQRPTFWTDDRVWAGDLDEFVKATISDGDNA